MSDSRSEFRGNPDYAINEIFIKIREMNEAILPLTHRLEDVIDSMPTDEHGKPSLKRHWQHHDGLSETGKNYSAIKNGFLTKIGGYVAVFCLCLLAGYIARVTH